MTSLFWRDQAACRDADLEIFFPQHVGGRSTSATAEATAICAECPVRVACRDFALNVGDDHGVWGGLSVQERRTARARRSADPSLTWDEVAPAPRPSLAEFFAARIEDTGDGHTRWMFSKTTLVVGDRRRTPLQVAFLLAHGRDPEGRVTPDCGVHGCVTGGHLADNQIRRERREADADAA